jgi:hypothetical protein
MTWGGLTIASCLAGRPQTLSPGRMHHMTPPPQAAPDSASPPPAVAEQYLAPPVITAHALQQDFAGEYRRSIMQDDQLGAVLPGEGGGQREGRPRRLGPVHRHEDTPYRERGSTLRVLTDRVSDPVPWTVAEHRSDRVEQGGAAQKAKAGTPPGQRLPNRPAVGTIRLNLCMSARCVASGVEQCLRP